MKATGLTLLEVLLALLIATMVILFGVKSYEQRKKFVDIAQITSDVRLLMQAGADYYSDVCWQNAYADSSQLPAYVIAKNKPYTLSDDLLKVYVAKDTFVNSLLRAEINEGSKSDISPYAVQIYPLAMTERTRNKKFPLHCKGNQLCQTILWTVRVSAKMNPELTEKAVEIYGHQLNADVIDKKNKMLSWDKLPRRVLNANGISSTRISQDYSNKMYRFGRWMAKYQEQKGDWQQRINSLCQL